MINSAVKEACKDNRLFLISCSLMIFYLSYRYPLQINSSLTSPTYSDTPFVLQIGKYVILSVIILGMFLIPVGNHKYRRCNIYALSFSLLIFCYLLYKYIVYSQIEFLYLVPVYVLPALFTGLINKIDAKSFSMPIKTLMVITFLVNFIQVLLFLFMGRLPALAYENSLSVRFGSFLDDPNGFGLLCIIFIGWVHIKYQRNKFMRTAVQFTIIFMILMTQSLTILGLAAIVFLFLYAKDIVFIISSLFVSTLVFFLIPNLKEKLWQAYELKKGSIDDHLSISIDLEYATEVILGGKYTPQESWWISSFISNGPVITLLVVSFGIIGSVHLFRQYKLAIDVDERAVLFSLFLFSVLFMVGSLNLPFFDVFPLNFIYLTLLFMSLQGKLISNDVDHK